MRIFTAIPFPAEIKKKSEEVMRGKLPVPYVNSTNFHITLNFLGELDTDQFKKIKDYWTEGLPEIQKIRIDFDKLVKLNQQIHMTLKPNPELMAMQDMLKKYFDTLGFRPTYSQYYPHVKITNLHMDKVMNRERKMESFPNEELAQLSFIADRIVLYESKLLLHHAHHIELAEHKLT